MKKLTLVLLALIIGLATACSSPPVNGPAPGPTPLPGGPNPPPGAILQTLPADMPRPAPVARTFEGCPAQGDGGDPELNQLKNRVDTGAWQRAAVASVLALTWPKAIERQRHSSWSAADRAAIKRYEGLPLQIEGYLAGAKSQGPESSNCHAVDYVDYHLWLVDAPNKTRDQSVVIEVTPRLRAQHPGWDISRLRTLVTNQTRVRISGWLMMDQEHPDQIGKTRGTIWEIHPIIEIEVAQVGGWQPLDRASSAPIPALPIPTQPDEPPPLVETPEPGVIPPTPNPLGSSDSSSDVKILSVKANGTATNQADEYVEIQNQGTNPVVMDGWTLSDAANHAFRWDSFTIQPGQKIRVYTNQVHRDTGGFSFHSVQPIWNNSGDTAYLHDANDNVVATFHYGSSR